ncbi:putative U4/U6 small nuclear ribonucleoprotein Prp31 [Paratrimastix pyriformis]|uniref:U4/U6 small nuclear ribonucleoprotein Prp31 n=1 Tax=Paratrimastix pyriformis TaxID=342808 RepID=A0ABQ8U6K0_9EUKA|nr:putative U4/U6 small nuclear ribonucleoprotein Prp31 [Paratrimastix pyriformis]
MQFIAPNLSALVGPNIAAKLMAAAGGLDKLSRIPACNLQLSRIPACNLQNPRIICKNPAAQQDARMQPPDKHNLGIIPACNLQILGAKKRHSAGFSTAATLPHTGYVFSSAVVQQAPSDLRMKASRVLAGRVALCSRLDYFHDQPEGGQGLEYKEEILKKIEKWQEPPPPKQIKPLAPPIAVPKKKRGGKRARKMKEKTAMTDVRKFQNRIKFGQAEDEYSNTGKGFGMLGQEGSAVRITTSAKQQLKVSKKFMKGNKGLANPGRATSGLATSLAFTPVQGIELENPNARAEKVRKANERYFSLDAPLVSDRLKRSRSDEPTSTSTATATKQEP